MPHQPKPGDVLISLTNGAYGDGTRAINLRIEDETMVEHLGETSPRARKAWHA